jgi:hypothetical protein
MTTLSMSNTNNPSNIFIVSYLDAEVKCQLEFLAIIIDSLRAISQLFFGLLL